MSLAILRFIVAISLAAATARGVYLLAVEPPLPRPQGGYRSERRDRAFKPNSLAEKVLRVGGGWCLRCVRAWRGLGPGCARIVARLEQAQLKQLVWAGLPLGLSVYEAFFLTGGLAWFGLLLGLYLSHTQQSWVWTFPCMVFFASLFPVRLKSLAAERLLVLSHQFPAVIELTALAMNAGSDLPSALTKIAARQTGAVADELRQLLLALEMGLTRRAALLALEERCPVDEVRDLVRAVLIAEKKGASVTAALMQQAQTSRQRRSVRAEESAARAGVLLMLPLMLLMGCVLILLVGPLVCRGQNF